MIKKVEISPLKAQIPLKALDLKNVQMCPANLTPLSEKLL